MVVLWSQRGRESNSSGVKCMSLSTYQGEGVPSLVSSLSCVSGGGGTKSCLVAVMCIIVQGKAGVLEG